MGLRCNANLRLPFLGITLVITASFASLAHAGTFEVATSAELSQMMAQIRATQFLQRATFGPKQQEIDDLAARMLQIGMNQAAEEWIDAQFALAPTSHVDTAKAMIAADGWAVDQSGVNIVRYRHQTWWHNSITAPDQLKQRIAWALIQIFVINQNGAGFNNNALDGNGDASWLGLCAYYDMLLANSDGNYRDLLGDVTKSPIMGTFLSHLRNGKGDPANGIFPDENFAREVMQLFSIGLYKLKINGVFRRDADDELVPTYDNETIKAFARLFTGLTFNGNTNFNAFPRKLSVPMTMLDSEHDPDDKVLLDGFVLPGNTDGLADLEAGLDHLFDHANVGPFMARMLIQRLVRSNPSKGYIKRVALKFNDNGSGVRGDMKAVIKTILLDRECWNSIRMVRKRDPLRLRVKSTSDERNRMIEPVVMYAGFMRRFGTTPADGWFKLPTLSYNWTQAPYQAPSVFNFYLPNHQPAGPITTDIPSKRIPNGALFAPEFQLFTSVVANRMANRYRSDLRNGQATYTLVNNATTGQVQQTVVFDFSTEEGLATDATALAKHLDLTLCAGTMTDSFRNELAAALEEETTDPVDRARGGLLSVLTSPAAMIVE